jgi:hypothetical protein
MLIFLPQALRMKPIEAAETPLPIPDITPPEMKINFDILIILEVINQSI